MTAVDEARERLGKVGVGLVTPIAPADEWRRTARRIEEAGYGAIWLNETMAGREVFSQIGVLLAATDRIVVGSAIANLWRRHAAATQGAAAVLGDAYPGRLAVGLGVSMGPLVEQSGQKWTSPLTKMREYLDGMDASADAAPDARFPRLVAALGPKMQELARDRADGVLPAAMPVEHTKLARERLGQDKLLIVVQPTILETDPGKAREIARGTRLLGQPGSPYDRALKTLGYEEFTGDAVIDACFNWGDETAIAKRAQDHLDAGADHVALVAFAPDLSSTVAQYERLAPFLPGQRGRTRPVS